MISVHFLILLSIINSYSAYPCNFDAGLQLHLRSQGFYSDVTLQFRNMTFKITFGDVKYGDRYHYDQCYVGLDQKLPAGVYAYPDELRDLKRMKKLTAILRNRVNIELPAEESHPTSVFIIGKVENGEVNLWLPVHARYHYAQKAGGYVRNDIEPPRVFLRCPHKRLDQCEPKTFLIKYLCDSVGKKMCTWKHVPTILLTDPIFFIAVPIGNVDHDQLVIPVTIGAVIVCTIFVLKTVHDFNVDRIKRCKRL